MSSQPKDLRERNRQSDDWEERAREPERPAARSDIGERDQPFAESSTGPNSSSAAHHNPGIDQFPEEEDK